MARHKYVSRAPAVRERYIVFSLDARPGQLPHVRPPYRGYTQFASALTLVIASIACALLAHAHQVLQMLAILQVDTPAWLPDYSEARRSKSA